MTDYDFEHLEHIMQQVADGEVDPEEGIQAFRQHLVNEYGIEPEQLLA